MELIRVKYLENGHINSVEIPNDNDKDVWELLNTHEPYLYDRLTENDIIEVEII